MKRASFKILTTPRLFLRQLTDSDAASLSALRSNEKVNLYIDRPAQTSLEEAKVFIKKINAGIEKGTSWYWVISLKESSALVGTICLWNFSADNTMAEVGYELDPAFHGQGIMSEALHCIVSFAFQSLHLDTIEAFTHKENKSSIQLLLKHNFKLEPDRFDTENKHNIVFSLKRGERPGSTSVN